YCSLLRVLEADGDAAKLEAFVEQAPRVWVELGCRQPLAEQIRPPTGKILFIRRPRRWSFDDDEPFQPEIDQFALSAVPAMCIKGAPDCRLKVPLRLAACATHEPGSLWVLRHRALEQLTDLLRDADDALLAGLQIAITESEAASVVILRAKSARATAPVLLLDAEGYHPYLKLPHLYVPCGRRLRPALRRDRVRELLGDSGQQVIWLVHRPDGSLMIQSVTEAAFVPLLELVQYFREHAEQRLTPWRQTGVFAFEPFASRG